MSELRSVRASEQQAPIVAEILTDATKIKAAHGDRAWGNEPWTDKEVRELMQHSDIYVVNEDNEAVATFSMQWDDKVIWENSDPSAAYIHRVAIRNDKRGTGLGSKVIGIAEQIAASNGRELLRLDCPADNEQLCAYYEHQGFTRVATRTIPEHNNYQAALYERPIK